MSVLDRAIVKAFQRRHESDAVAKTAEADRRALQEAVANAAVADAASVRERTGRVDTDRVDSDGSNAVADAGSILHVAPIPSPEITSSPPAIPERYQSPEPITVIQPIEAAVSVPPPIPAPVSERPAPQNWKWPEICEQLDQFTGEGFRQLAKHLQFAAEQGHKVLGFVSSARNAGRTSVLMTLTRILALEAKTEVLLIDADRKHPHLAELSGYDPINGLSELLHGQCRPPQAVMPMSPGRISLLPLTETVGEVEWQTLVSPLRTLLKQARRDYDMILIDVGVMGPETKLADCWLKGAVDAVITISRQLNGKRTEHEVLNWKHIGIESLGVIETFA